MLVCVFYIIFFIFYFFLIFLILEKMCYVSSYHRVTLKKKCQV